jgi:hypothetical protein
MSATFDTLVDLSSPRDAAAEVARLNDRLAGERTIPPALAREVRTLAEAIERTELRRWDAIDPRHALALLRGAVAAQLALDGSGRGARDRLRVALESIRQALTAIAEREPVADERTPKELVRWLVETAEVPQARLAELFGISPRQFQRWASSSDPAAPDAEDAGKVRAVARVVNQLRFVLTPSGAIEWFGWPRSDLGGKAPAALLGDAHALPDLVAVAGSMRGQYAA